MERTISTSKKVLDSFTICDPSLKFLPAVEEYYNYLQ